MRAFIIALFVIFLPLSLYAQDRDSDRINDILEHKLALKFAPEWRFNYRVEGDNSQQNNNEVAFPSSVEWFYNEVVAEQGSRPRVRFQAGSFVTTTTLFGMEQLSELADQFAGKRADDPFWEQPPNSLRIINYPKWIGGDPEHFPTYYHCDILDDGNFAIQFYLWFPWDYAGKYDLGLFTVEKGWHRGDWENITVVLNGLGNLNDTEVYSGVTIAKVIYYGHFVPGKIINGTPSYIVDGTHPQVFVAWGTHAMYPEPGEWHNHELQNDPFYCEECDDPFDDFFHGNGYVVQSWHPARELINLGEHNQDMPQISFKKWIRFRGLWGEGGDRENGSPPSPVWRGRWFTLGDTDDWETIKLNYRQHHWENPPELDGSIVFPYGFEAEGSSRVILFEDDHWQGNATSTGILDCANIGIQASSAWVLGAARAILYSGGGCSGQAFSLTHSCQDLQRHSNHNFGDKTKSLKVSLGMTQVYADWRNFAGYQDGSQNTGTHSGPFSTAGRAFFHVNKGGEIVAKGGNYPEILTLDKSMTIKAEGGTVIVGKLDQ